MSKQQPAQPGIMQLGSAMLSDAYNPASGLNFESVSVRIIQAENITMVQSISLNIQSAIINSQNMTALTQISTNMPILLEISRVMTVQV